MDRDFERAVGRLVDVGCELHDVAGVEIAVRIRRRHVPFGLRGRTSRNPQASNKPAQTRTKFFIGLSTISTEHSNESKHGAKSSGAGKSMPEKVCSDRIDAVCPQRRARPRAR